MSDQSVLEICVETLDHAVAAERGGAQRIELCSDLPSGGVTPSAELMQSVRRQVSIPIHVLVRPRAGDFFYSDREFAAMQNDIRTAQQLGMNGVVLGVLRENGHIDVERTTSLVALAGPLSTTFHRAFDASENFDVSLEDVIRTGASRILTSGGRQRAMESLPNLARLAQMAQDRIVLMPGGGINSENLAAVAQTTLAREFHTSVGTSQIPRNNRGNGSSGNGMLSEKESEIFQEKVAELVALLHDLSQRRPAN